MPDLTPKILTTFTSPGLIMVPTIINIYLVSPTETREGGSIPF